MKVYITIIIIFQFDTKNEVNGTQLKVLSAC